MSLCNSTKKKKKNVIGNDPGTKEDAVFQVVGMFESRPCPTAYHYCVQGGGLTFSLAPVREAEHQAAFLEQISILDVHLTRDTDYYVLMCEAVVFDKGMNL